MENTDIFQKNSHIYVFTLILFHSILIYSSQPKTTKSAFLNMILCVIEKKKKEQS